MALTPHDTLLIITRIALAAAVGDIVQYNALLARYVGPLSPATQTMLRNSDEAASLSILHLAASFDRATLLRHLAVTFTRADTTTQMLVLVAKTFVRVAAGAVVAGEACPWLPIEGDGSLVGVTDKVLHLVRWRSAEDGENAWAAALWSRAVAEFLVARGGQAPSEPSPPSHTEGEDEAETHVAAAPPPAPTDARARKIATAAVHLEPWSRDCWDALEATSVSRDR